jgi:hypothetical protein
MYKDLDEETLVYPEMEQFPFDEAFLKHEGKCSVYKLFETINLINFVKKIELPPK